MSMLEGNRTRDDGTDLTRNADMQSTGDALQTIRAGFIPLIDCAALVVAVECGFAKSAGLDLVLSKEPSWAAIRDKVTVGHLDCAHMLGPMVVASTLGVGHIRVPLIAPVALGLNGNAITMSTAIYERMAAVGLTARDVVSGARALKRVIDDDKAKGRAPLTLAIVFPFSAHNYELRSWLAAGGINPDFDVRLVVVPPAMMVANLEQGLIDGFCVGAPWNSVAAEAGLGHIVATKSEIWRNGPEKVLGVRQEWAEQHPILLNKLIRVLVQSAAWAGDTENLDPLAEILAGPSYLATPISTVRSVLSGAIPRPPALTPDQPDNDFITFYRNFATFPWLSHGVWFTDQMIKWRQIDPKTDSRAIAQQVYRPDLYRSAVAALETDVPDEDWQAKGDGLVFGDTPE